ncbi:MAG: hypothetical protein JO277_02350 [Candidatus Eremiobacteraeota bacterium]|nr:hypothetical protein [Candidatus Eremiobacteraeota bacterium]
MSYIIGLILVWLVSRFEANCPGLAAIELDESVDVAEAGGSLARSGSRFDIDGEYLFVECR